MANVAKRNVEPVRDAGLLSEKYGFSANKVAYLQAALIALVTCWIYSPALNGDWLWDDTMYVSHNPLLSQPGRLFKAWFQPGSFIEYYPIEQTVQWVQWQLWGLNPLPYHITNVALHIVNALLVWRLLGKLGVKLAWLGGLLFAVHPVHVESVAWISELKNTLSLGPILLSLSAWVDFEERRDLRDYRLALGFFVVGMLCKISAAMFPFVILLYAWWKRGRIGGRDFYAAGPFFLVSLALGLTTISAGGIYLHHNHATAAAIPIGGLGAHLALAGTTLAYYFSEFFAPLDLLPVHPQWVVEPPSWLDMLPWLVFVGLFAWCWSARRSWGRNALLGLGFFFLNLLPFSGLHGISYMGFTWVMEHFLYLPSIGLVGLVAAALGDLDDRIASSSQVISTGLITLLIALLAFRSHWYAAAFTNSETFWEYAAESSPGSWMAQNNYGKALLEDGEYDKAIAHLRAAVAENPTLAGLHGDLGNALAQSGLPKMGMAEMRRALALDPYDASTNNNLGVLLARVGRVDEAIDCLILAVRAKPDDPEAYSNLGNAYYTGGRLDLAVYWYRLALQLNPRYPDAHNNLGSVWLQQKKYTDAAAEFQKAIELRPGYVVARNNLAATLAEGGRPYDAIVQYQITLQIDPGNRVARDSLAKLQADLHVP
jgi:tetratricopeptide (TPR) repeat protein